MISILHHMSPILRLTALNLIGIFLLAVTLCVALPFFLVIVSIGTASMGAYALGSRWDNGRRKRSVRSVKCLNGFTRHRQLDTARNPNEANK
jgi:hypothetical protein